MDPIDSKRSYLFAMWEGGGNVPPMLSLARKLIERGHTVRWLGDGCQAEEVYGIGADFSSWTRAPHRADRDNASDFLRDYEAANPVEQFALLRDRLMIGPAGLHAQDLIEALREQPADALVSSEMLFGAMLAAEQTGTPLVLVGSQLSIFPVPGIPPLGSGLPPARDEAMRVLQAEIAGQGMALMNQALPALNAARAQLGLAALEHVGAQAAVARRYLLLTSRAFDFPATELPPHLRYVGPELEDPTWSAPWQSPWSEQDSRPLVLVAFSTTFQDQAAAVARTVAALNALRIRGLVTLGPALTEAPIAATEAVRAVASAPHSAVLPHSSVVVTHGGHGTVMRALVAGVPLLILPMGRDQHDNAIRVTERGAGLQLPAMATEQEIRMAIEQLLSEPRYREAARRLGDSIRAEAARSSAVAELEAAATRTAARAA